MSARLLRGSVMFILLSALAVAGFAGSACSSQGAQTRPSARPAQTDAVTATVSDAERSRVIALLGEKLEGIYIFPELGKKMSTALHENAARGQYAAISSPKALCEALTADLRQLSHDRHIYVSYSVAAPDGASNPARSEAAMNFGFVKLERLAGNVGYLDLQTFSSAKGASETAVAAMRFLANADAIIIDLRSNGGGNPAMVNLLCSYLFPPGQRKHLYDIRHRDPARLEQGWTLDYVPGPSLAEKDLYLLTSHGTFSAGEGFAYILQAEKRATVVGEVTSGAANPGEAVKLDEHFSVVIPNGQVISCVTQSNWEGVGVKPDKQVVAEKALKASHAMALRKLAQKHELDAEAAKVQATLEEELRGAE